MVHIMDGRAETPQLTAILMALAVRGETIDEITGFARAMREKAERIQPRVAGRIVDTCGTGGAPIKTFNVSTTAAFVAAGAGATVAKHGNRSVTSPSGSADVLEALGADLTRTPDEVRKIIEETRIGFLFAPRFHPAMKHAIPARRALGIRTVFNVLGPLTNPAGATAQVLGVYDERLVEPLAKVLLNLGTEEAIVLHGGGGLDEAGTLQPNRLATVHDGAVTVTQLDAVKLGIPRSTAAAIGGLPPAESARELRMILDGKSGPRADMVLLNAALAIQVAGLAADPQEGLALARRCIESGSARDRLQAYVEATGGRLQEQTA
jgi:anthranilate phosphoribosyltransferase